MGQRLSWSELYEFRNRIHQGYPEVWDLNILRKRFPLILGILHDELEGILLAIQFQVKAIYRTYNDAFLRYIFRVYLMARLHRYLGIDFAKSILVLAGQGKHPTAESA